MKRFLNIILISLMFSALLFGAENVNSKSSFQKPTLLANDYWMGVNRMNGVFRNNGVWFYDYTVGDWGLEWPKGSGSSPVFAGGEWISAKVNGETRIAGNIHGGSEFQPGEILPDGTASNPKDAKYKWYVIEPGGVGDWNDWPVSQGAPVDESGKPLLLGDKTMFSVWNDLANHGQFKTGKLGLEARQTIFSFNRADAMGDMMFIKWQLVNKGNADWDSTYFSIWLDPDVGDGWDDFVGSDPELGLGYCYNATNDDQIYGSAPPAVGFDFFQGPIIDNPDSSVTLPDGTVLEGKQMLKMTAFIFYNNDDSPQGNPNTGADARNYQRGFWQDNSPVMDPAGNKVPFMFNGDPETNVGWLDSNEGDRRFLMTTGPFFMPKWQDVNGNGLADFGEPGVQEIVAGVIVARGESNLNSVTKLKEVDELAQMAYNLDFNLARPPYPPVLDVSEKSNEVILSWNGNSELNLDGSLYDSEDPIVANALGDTVIIDNVVTEITDATYNFYGYSVYQYSDASGKDPVLIGHWDIGETEDAQPYTGTRFIKIDQNKNPAVGLVGKPLVNGKPYYYGVVAHGYCQFGAPRIFNSAPTIVTVLPHNTPGIRTYSEYNDTLDVQHVVTDPGKSPSDGSAVVWVVDPSRTTGKEYKVTFEADQTWNLLTADDDTLAKNQDNQSGNDAYNVYDGLMVKVIGPTPGINTTKPGPYGDDPAENGWNWEGDRWISGVDAGGVTFFGGMFSGPDFFGSNITPTQYRNIELRFAGADMQTEPDRWQKGYVFRRDMGYAFFDMGDVPMTAWDVSDPANPRQINICFVEDAGSTTPNNLWDMGWNPVDSTFAANGGREYLFFMLSDYTPTATNTVYTSNSILSNADQFDCMYAIWPQTRGYAYLYADFEMQIYASKVNSTHDQFVFTAPAEVKVEQKYLKADVDKINVVPNPYYGYHSGEMDAFDRWVQFTNLPAKCTIRIFDLAGNLVRKLEKNDATTPFLRWSLENEYELPVASGVYVYHVDIPNIGTKVGKIAIFTPNERLDTY